jgi:hypothetical protein
MRRLAAVLGLVGAMLGAASGQEAQTNMNSYTIMDYEAGYMSSSFSGKIDRMTDGVRITLRSENPELKPIPIEANTMKFTWPEQGGNRPSRIVLEGKVVIDHPEANVRADKADWDFEKGILTFTGSPVMKGPQAPEGIEAQKIVLNFNEDRFEVYGGRAKEIRLGEMGGEEGGEHKAGPLRAEDVPDWPAFLAIVRTQAAANEPSPGKRLVSLLDPQVQQAITSDEVEQLLKDKGAIVKPINHALTNPKFYDAAAWQEIELGAEAKVLLGKGTRSTKESARLGRLLLEAAYPDLIVTSGK